MMLGAAAHAQNEGAVPDGGSASGPGTGSKIYDAAVLRPLGGIETLLGAAFYIATTPITLPLDQSEEAHDLFVVFPWDYTFDRSLGDF